MKPTRRCATRVEVFEPEEPFLAGIASRDIRFDADSIVHRVPELLLAAEVSLGRLNRDVPKQKLDLIEFAASQVAQPRAGATLMPTSA